MLKYIENIEKCVSFLGNQIIILIKYKSNNREIKYETPFQ